MLARPQPPRPAARGRVARALAAAAALPVGLVGLVAVAGPASAHVGTEATSTAAGSSAVVRFLIGHGCDGSPTTGVTIRLPDGVDGASPEAAPGWDVEVAGDTVRWTGGSLPDDQFQQFGLRLTLPDTPGETAWFPTVQTCEEGEHAWVEIPAEGGAEPASPAPGVAVTEAAQGGDDHGAGDEVAAPVTGASGDDGGTDTLAVVALVVGALGVALGGAGLVAARRSRP